MTSFCEEQDRTTGISTGWPSFAIRGMSAGLPPIAVNLEASAESLIDYDRALQIAKLAVPVSAPRAEVRVFSNSPTVNAAMSAGFTHRSSPGIYSVTAESPRLGAPLVRPRAWLDSIEMAIIGSRWIAGLPADWDGAEAPGVTTSTWDRAVRLLRQLARRAAGGNRSFPTPAISPNGGGSVDLFWNSPGAPLLINVPARWSEPAVFSGARGKQVQLVGAVSPETFDRVIDWLNN